MDVVDKLGSQAFYDENIACGIKNEYLIKSHYPKLTPYVAIVLHIKTYGVKKWKQEIFYVYKTYAKELV